MKIGTYTLAALKAIQDNSIFSGKTTVQKLIYFGLPTDKRRKFYKPYYYGPYSEAVQHAFGSLSRNEFITCVGNKYHLAKGEYQLKKYKDDDVVRRLFSAAEFLADKNLKATRDISILAKVHLLKQGKDITGQQLHEFIRQRGQYFGWKELTHDVLSEEQLQTYLDLADDLEAALPES